MREAFTLAVACVIASAQPALAQVMPSIRSTSPVTIKPPMAVKPAPLPLPLPMAPLAITYTYTATPQSGPPRQSGSFDAGAVWTCDQTNCKTTSPAALPAVGGCNALAHHIGPIGYYGHNGSVLSPEQLDDCNHDIPGAVRMAVEVTPPAEPTPASADASSPPAMSVPSPTPAAMPSGFAVYLPELAMVGGEQGTVDPVPAPIALEAGELSVSGGALGPVPADPPPLLVSVPELSLSGR